MSCCGRARTAMMPERANYLNDAEPVWLSYAGARSILVKGSATGRVYNFSPGTWLRVHAGDAVSMQGIPGLKKRDAAPEA